MSANQKKNVLHRTLSMDEARDSIKAVGSAVFYGTCSVSMAFINKALMTTFKFDYPVFIMVVQMIFTIFILELLSCLQLIQLPKYTLSRGKSFALPALFYALNSVLGLTALSHMNVAMYGVLKRCVPLVTMFLSVVILKQGFPSKKTIASVICLTSGCIVAGYGDLQFNLAAYTCGGLSNLTQSLYLLLVQSMTSALTTSVVGGIKAMLQTLFGLFTFGGISHNMATYVGIGMNLSGGLYYIFSKFSEGKSKHRSEESLKKIISISTAEDFKKYANGSLKTSASTSKLKPIPEQTDSQEKV
ncbi:SLC35D [Mytilus edulis]|uniref:SLC35D n=1 Tax=Mytilus edulis TaxID=6550 RepID=A0A8S3TZ78_MYTED|nr:SLC35D [Mytilus edulis]